MQRQRAAAALGTGDDHVAALRREHPGRGRVDPGEEDLLHAAGEHADYRPALAAGRHPAGQHQRAWPAAVAGRVLRCQPQGRGEFGGEPLRSTAAPGQPVEAGPLRAAQRAHEGPQPPGVGEGREDGCPHGPLPERAGGARAEPGRWLLDPGTGRLDEPVIADAGRAGRHAGHAAEAAVEVGGGRLRELRTGECLADEMDAAAWRVHLFAPQLVGRAGGQAEAAVDTVRRHRSQLAGGVERMSHGAVGSGESPASPAVAPRFSGGCAGPSPGLAPSSDSSSETSGRHPVLRIELILDSPHQRQPRCRAPQVHQFPHRGRGVHHDRAGEHGAPAQRRAVRHRLRTAGLASAFPRARASRRAARKAATAVGGVSAPSAT